MAFPPQHYWAGPVKHNGHNASLMCFSHLPGTPEPSPSPQPVAILCSGRSFLGSPTLCSSEDGRLEAWLFISSFKQAPCSFQSPISAPPTPLHQNALLGPFYQPDAVQSGREIGFESQLTFRSSDLGKLCNLLEPWFPLGKWGELSFLWGI